MAATSYDDAVAALGGALVFGTNPSLDGIVSLCAALGRPQDTFASVQVTGTNGKTSTARMTHALLRAHGRNAGLYTSPELERVNERIEVGTGPVSDAEFAAAVGAVLDAAERLRPGVQGQVSGFTEFELTTAAALWLFRERSIDTAVLEVGLGGRWDATSVVSPAVSVITGVALDHTAVLGDTLEMIAAEKAAIIKPASAPVLGPGTAGLDAVFIERSREVGTHARAVREGSDPSPAEEALTVRYEVTGRPDSPGGLTTFDVRGIHDDYRGLSVAAPAYQAGNVATAIAATEAALGRGLHAGNVQRALDGLTVPGRFELVCERPPVIVDGSHNPQAARFLAAAIAAAWPDPALRPLVVLGVLADKDAAGIVRALAPAASEFIVTAPRAPRALAAHTLAAIVARETGREARIVEPVGTAVEQAMRYGTHGVVVTGSLTTAGQARVALRDASATA